MSALARHNVHQTGTGPAALVFVHGFGCDQSMWRKVAPHFHDSHRVVLLDLMGAGGSDLSAYDAARYDTLEGHAEDMVDLLSELDLDDVTFVGHSVSAMIGILAARKRQGLISRLVLVCPSPRYLNDDGYVGGFHRQDIDELLDVLDSNWLGWSRSMAPVFMGTPDRPELGQELTNAFCRTDPAIARQFARATFLSDNRTDLATVTVPTLILQCRDDVLAPMAVGNYVQAGITGSTLVVLDATGHCPHMSAPDATVSALSAFLSARLK